MTSTFVIIDTFITEKDTESIAQIASKVIDKEENINDFCYKYSEILRFAEINKHRGFKFEYNDAEYLILKLISPLIFEYIPDLKIKYKYPIYQTIQEKIYQNLFEIIKKKDKNKQDCYIKFFNKFYQLSCENELLRLYLKTFIVKNENIDRLYGYNYYDKYFMSSLNKQFMEFIEDNL